MLDAATRGGDTVDVALPLQMGLSLESAPYLPQ
jgi:hypothetical protein